MYFNSLFLFIDNDDAKRVILMLRHGDCHFSSFSRGECEAGANPNIWGFPVFLLQMLKHFYHKFVNVVVVKLVCFYWSNTLAIFVIYDKKFYSILHTSLESFCSEVIGWGFSNFRIMPMTSLSVYQFPRWDCMMFLMMSSIGSSFGSWKVIINIVKLSFLRGLVFIFQKFR